MTARSGTHDVTEALTGEELEKAREKATGNLDAMCSTESPLTVLRLLATIAARDAEIERLRDLSTGVVKASDAAAQYANCRARTIEECAKVLEGYAGTFGRDMAGATVVECANRIRALSTPAFDSPWDEGAKVKRVLLAEKVAFYSRHMEPATPAPTSCPICEHGGPIQSSHKCAPKPEPRGEEPCDAYTLLVKQHAALANERDEARERVRVLEAVVTLARKVAKSESHGKIKYELMGELRSALWRMDGCP